MQRVKWGKNECYWQFSTLFVQYIFHAKQKCPLTVRIPHQKGA